ncbi:MAG: NAD(P)-dependent oxidoreductase [Bacteroidales bacterium]|nr:NAD(P)-dependent oxidoreductase [Bacteroidales bacterium]MDY0216625.1 NAD(P)-dependent oxidoreductase [Bacteroidales bacterium]
MKPKVLFLDSTHPILYEKLKELGFEILHEFDKTKEELIPQLKDIEGLIIRSRMKIDAEIMQHSPSLKFIGRVGSGLENIDLEYAKSKGIFCINSPEGNRDAVAEHTLGMLLCLKNNILKSDKEVRNGFWLREENRGIEISGKTIAIIGFGNMGSAFAQRLKGFDCTILAYDKYKTNYAPDYVKETTLEDVFENADIVSYHIPYNPENHYLINTNHINLFKKTITILNTSRGKILNTQDLVAALKSGKVNGACLDVLEYESVNLQNLEKDQWPEAMTQLAMMQNVVLSSHIAGWTQESNIKLSLFLIEKIKKVLQLQ